VSVSFIDIKDITNKQTHKNKQKQNKVNKQQNKTKTNTNITSVFKRISQ
jgi:hypothetical protein